MSAVDNKIHVFISTDNYTAHFFNNNLPERPNLIKWIIIAVRTINTAIFRAKRDKINFLTTDIVC